MNIRVLSLCCLAMICLTTNVYAQEKKGKGRDNPPAKERDYPPAKERDNPLGKGRDYPPAKERDYPPMKERDNPPAKERDYPPSAGFRGTSQPIGSLLVTKSGQVQATPVASAKSLAYDTPVMLVGKIIRSVGEDLYTFKDASGEIAVRIKLSDWKGLSIEEADDIVIAGYVKSRGDGSVEIDVKMISKTKT